jgi:hypothetical protein
MLFGTEQLWRPCLLKAVGGEGGPAPWAEDLGLNSARATGPSQPSAGVLGELSRALVSARAALSNILELISLEARRAGIALMWMVVLGAVAAVCLVAAWLGFMAAFAMGAISLGLTPIAAVIAVASINLVAGAILIKVSMGMSRDLLFSATRRQVAGQFPVPPSTP